MFSRSRQSDSNNISIYNDSVPEALEIDLIRCVITEYAASYQFCYGNLSHGSARDLYPLFRTARIESKVQEVLLNYPFAKVVEKPNRPNTANHIEIICNDVILTFNAVDNRNTLIRRAEFRETLARDSQQLWIPDMPSYDETLGNVLYAIFLHGDSTSNRPTFTDIVFPDEKCKKYLDRIALLDKYKDIFHAQKSEIEQVEPIEIIIKEVEGREGNIE